MLKVTVSFYKETHDGMWDTTTFPRTAEGSHIHLLQLGPRCGRDGWRSSAPTLRVRSVPWSLIPTKDDVHGSRCKGGAGPEQNLLSHTSRPLLGALHRLVTSPEASRSGIGRGVQSSGSHSSAIQEIQTWPMSRPVKLHLGEFLEDILHS